MAVPSFHELPLPTKITVVLGLIMIAAAAFVSKQPLWGILGIALTYLIFAYNSFCWIRGGCNAWAWLHLVLITLAVVGTLLALGMGGIPAATLAPYMESFKGDKIPVPKGGRFKSSTV